MMARAQLDSVVSVLQLPLAQSPDLLLRLDPGGFLEPWDGHGAPITRRQDARPAYQRDGTVYVTRRRVVETTGTLYGQYSLPLFVSHHETCALDSREDWDALRGRTVYCTCKGHS